MVLIRSITHWCMAYSHTANLLLGIGCGVLRTLHSCRGLSYGGLIAPKYFTINCSQQALIEHSNTASLLLFRHSNFIDPCVSSAVFWPDCFDKCGQYIGLLRRLSLSYAKPSRLDRNFCENANMTHPPISAVSTAFECMRIKF